VDTPGIHRPRTLLGQRLNDVVEASLSDVDAIAFLLPADQAIGPGDRRILSRLRSDFARKDKDGKWIWRKPLIAVVTKIDQLSKGQLVDKLLEIGAFADFSQIVPVSALEADNVDEVAQVLIDAMPEGPQLYPDDQLTEERPEDMIAELVRGAYLEELDDELPHSLAVRVESIEPDPEGGRDTVHIGIYVERDSQKPIVIGRGAEHLVRVKKKLRTAVNRTMFTVHKDGHLETPSLTGTILPGVTRNSLIALAQDHGRDVVETMIRLDTLLDDIRSGEVTEVFACGTAAIITPIGRFKSENFDVQVADGGSGKVTMDFRNELLGIQLGEIEDPHDWMWKVC